MPCVNVLHEKQPAKNKAGAKRVTQRVSKEREATRRQN